MANPLRPVPKHRPRIATGREAPADPQRDGWNLKWRQSDQVENARGDRDPARVHRTDSTPRTASAPRTAAARRDAGSDGRSASLGDLLSRSRPATRRSPRHRTSDVSSGVAQAAWLNQPAQGETLDQPGGPSAATTESSSTDGAHGAETDFFNDPFGDAAPARPRQPRRAAAPGSGSEPKTMPAPPEVIELPAPEPESPSGSETPSDRQQPSDLAAPQRSRTLPAPQSAPQSDGDSSLGKMLRQSRPEDPDPPRDETESTRVDPDRALTQPANSRPAASAPEPQPLSAPQTQPSPQRPAPANQRPPASESQTQPQSQPPSPSDLLQPAPNPFERDVPSNRRPPRGEAQPSDARSQRTPLFGEDEQARAASGISCEEFRERIAGQTIRQVSLDISPPFRPDVIEQARYEELKAEFDEAQELRQWRSIEGRPLVEGRLRDLAYEKIVLETEDGETERLPISELSEADLAYISANWGLPIECRIEQVEFAPRQWQPTTMTWAASNLCHHPLYFQQVNLERYGHTAGPFLQPVVSSAHFFANIAVLPYKMGVHAPHECQYALGYYRPGNCAPWIVPPVPISARGALSQAAVMTGTFWLVP